MTNNQCALCAGECECECGYVVEDEEEGPAIVESSSRPICQTSHAV